MPSDQPQWTVDAVARAIYESAVEGTMREPESWEELEETAREPWRRNARAASLATIEWLATTPMPDATPGFADAFRRLMRRKEDEIDRSERAEGGGEEPTPLMRALRNLTGFDHVGCTAHDAVECIGAYREAVEQMLAAHEQSGGDGWWKGWEMLKAVYNGER